MPQYFVFSSYMTDFYVKSVVNTTETDRTAGYIDTVGCDNGNEDHYGYVVIQDYVDKVGHFHCNYIMSILNIL